MAEDGASVIGMGRWHPIMFWGLRRVNLGATTVIDFTVGQAIGWPKSPLSEELLMRKKRTWLYLGILASLLAAGVLAATQGGGQARIRLRRPGPRSWTPSWGICWLSRRAVSSPPLPARQGPPSVGATGWVHFT